MSHLENLLKKKPNKTLNFRSYTKDPPRVKFGKLDRQALQLVIIIKKFGKHFLACLPNQRCGDHFRNASVCDVNIKELRKIQENGQKVR